MSGNKIVLDTNAVIALLKGNDSLLKLCREADLIAVSVISKLEFLAYPELEETDKTLFDRFEQRVEMISLDNRRVDLIDCIIDLRSRYTIKLPDAIIAATAMVANAQLVTADKVFEKVHDLEVVSFCHF